MSNLIPYNNGRRFSNSPYDSGYGSAIGPYGSPGMGHGYGYPGMMNDPYARRYSMYDGGYGDPYYHGRLGISPTVAIAVVDLDGARAADMAASTAIAAAAAVGATANTPMTRIIPPLGMAADMLPLHMHAPLCDPAIGGFGGAPFMNGAGGVGAYGGNPLMGGGGLGYQGIGGAGFVGGSGMGMGGAAGMVGANNYNGGVGGLGNYAAGGVHGGLQGQYSGVRSPGMGGGPYSAGHGGAGSYLGSNTYRSHGVGGMNGNRGRGYGSNVQSRYGDDDDDFVNGGGRLEEVDD